MALAQLPLLVHQAGDVVADHAGTQRSDVPEVDRSNREFRGAGHQSATEISSGVQHCPAGDANAIVLK